MTAANSTRASPRRLPCSTKLLVVMPLAWPPNNKRTTAWDCSAVFGPLSVGLLDRQDGWRRALWILRQGGRRRQCGGTQRQYGYSTDGAGSGWCDHGIPLYPFVTA